MHWNSTTDSNLPAFSTGMRLSSMHSHNVYYVIKLPCFPYHGTYEMIVHTKLTFGNNAPWSACNGHCNVLHLALARTLRCIINVRWTAHRNLTSIANDISYSLAYSLSRSAEKIKSISKCRIVSRESCSQKCALYAVYAVYVIAIGISVLFSCSLISICCMYVLSFVCFNLYCLSYEDMAINWY